MMNILMKWFVILLGTSMLLFSCEQENLTQEDNQLVVEGWIEEGEFPIIMLTTTAALSTEKQDISSWDNYLLRWARVSIDDGNGEVVLTGKVDKRYMPPYIYTTSRIRGVAGRTYKLMVSYDNYYAEAETTIPKSIPIDSIAVYSTEETDLFQLAAFIDDPQKERNFYKFFMKIKGTDEIYLPTFIGTVSDEVFGDVVEIPIYQPQRIFKEDYNPYFSVDDTIQLKLAHMDSISYHFWKSYDDMNAFSGNMFFPANTNLPTNIKGGIGYWSGYGISNHSLVLREYIR